MDNNNNSDSGFGEVAERETPIENETEDTQDEQVENDSTDSQDNGSDQTDDQEGQDGNEGENQEDDSQEPTQKTEKGTKLDPNPKSAVHQQLANERRVRGQMETVLADPSKIARFVKEQYGIEMPLPGRAASQEQPAQGQQINPTSIKKYTAKDFEHIEDVANVVNGLQEQFQNTISERDKKIEDLTKQVTGIQEGGRIRHIADSLENDVTGLRSLPELNPNSPDYVSGLEDEIGALYHKLDFDEASGMYRGNYSLKELGQSIIATARKARKAGSRQAQTIIKDRTGGRVRTSQAANGQANGQALPPGQSIAQGIAKMFPRG